MPRARRETVGHPESATGEGPYVSEDGALMGRDFVIPGVDPREHDPVPLPHRPQA